MDKNKYIFSPIYYMGNKYKLLKYILPLFPDNIENFYDLFGGSGVVSINVSAKNKYYNEINENVYNLFKMFQDNKPEQLDEYISSKIKEFNIKHFDKNYKEHIDEQQAYYDFRNYYNSQDVKDYRDLYILICYSMNHLMRFNSKNEFNASIGSTQRYVKEYIYNAYEPMKQVNISCKNYKEVPIKENCFVYCDPPYFNTLAVYNEKRAYGGWSIKDDLELFEYLEHLDKRNIKFGLSNVFKNRGKTNEHLIEWCYKNNWEVYHLGRNYHPFSKGNSNNDEVYITNYKGV